MQYGLSAPFFRRVLRKRLIEEVKAGRLTTQTPARQIEILCQKKLMSYSIADCVLYVNVSTDPAVLGITILVRYSAHDPFIFCGDIAVDLLK